MKGLYEKLRSIGLRTPYVRKYLLPEWWDDAAAISPAGFTEAVWIIARHLGVDPSQLRDDAASVKLPSNERVHYKLSGDAQPESVALARLLAEQVAKFVMLGAPQQKQEAHRDAGAIRTNILEAGAPWVSFGNVLDFCWSAGIPVLHVSELPAGTTKKMDGIQSGLGFSFNLYHSAGSQVGADTDETVGNYAINQHGFEGAVHYRQPLGLISINGEVGYGQHNYLLSADFPLEVPDTQYSAFHAGAHLDLHVTDHATIGFGGKLFYVLDNGDMSSLDWYGPGSASGFSLDASFVIPLPKQLFVKGDLNYRRFSTEFDGAGVITEEETVLGASDAAMNGSVNLGIQF